jgi:hypothetical protein
VAAGRGIEDDAVVHRVGPAIEVSEFLGPGLNCGGQPSVTNTDRIDVRSKGLGTVTLSLKGGPFAPGFSADPDGSSEIELSAGGDGLIALVGSSAPDHFRYMTAEGRSGLNLNPGPGDRDIDVFLPDQEAETLFVAEGGQGRDTIDVLGRPPVGIFATGNRGDDTLVARGAGPFGAILDGGKGRDRIVGSPGFDLIVPGRGADAINALGGSDLIEMGPDRRRDRVDCGGGRDRANRPEPFDRLRSCEHVRSGRH